MDKFVFFLDYTPQYSSRGQQQHTTAQHTYRGTPAPVTIQTTNEEEVPQRNNPYVQTRYNTQTQDIYQHSNLQEYTDDNNYQTQVSIKN